MSNTAFILTLAYPDTIVSHAVEWYSTYLKYIGIGNNTSVRAGHAAFVLINKKTGVLEYHDFGRYITSLPNGRVRSAITDNELYFSLKAKIKNDKIINLDDILKLLATSPNLTHGEGRLVASICNKIDYKLAKAYIDTMQKQEFIYYAAFKKEASNCARFVTDCIIASVTDDKIKKALKKSKWFTPSTIGNVLLANTEMTPFVVSEKGVVLNYKGSQLIENLNCFLDRLKDYEPNYEGTLKPKNVDGLHEKAQWLSGIGTGAWYEIYKTETLNEYRYRRISPYGNIDCDAVFVDKKGCFDYEKPYQITHYSNCAYFHLKQEGNIIKFLRKEA